MPHEAVTIHDRRERRLAFDLSDLLRLAEADVRASTWHCSDVECSGSAGAELHNLSDRGTKVDGADLLRIAAALDQTIDGDFEGYRSADAAKPWLVIRAIRGTEFVVSTDDATLLGRVRAKFRDVRASPRDAEDVA